MDPIPNAEMFKWSIQIGGPVLALAIVVLTMYRKDMRRALLDSQTREDALIELIKSAVSTMQSTRDETARMSRAVEAIVARDRG